MLMKQTRQTYNYPLKWFREIEPILKSCYGIDRYDIDKELERTLQHTKLSDLPNIEKYKEGNTYHITDYAVENSETVVITIDTSTVNYEDYDIAKYKNTIKDFNLILDEFIKKYNYPEDSILNKVLTFVCLYFLKVEIESFFDGDEDEYYQYVLNIRPEMLRLYVALKKGAYDESCSISVGSKKPITVKVDKPQTIIPWFRLHLEEYLDKHLGVGSLKEAELELLNVYGKKVGPKQNPELARLYWGTYHLLQMSDEHKSKSLNSVTNEQSRFIADFAILLGKLDHEYKDGKRVRTLVKHYIKNFKTIDELIPATQYKLPPNYKSLKRLY